MKDLRQYCSSDLNKLGMEPTGNDVNLLRSVLHNLVEELSDGVAVARIMDGNAPLLYVNKAFEKLTGYERHEVLGKDCRYLQGNDREQAEVSHIRSAIEANEPVDVTLRNYRKDGSEFWNSLSLRPIRGLRTNCSISGYSGTCQAFVEPKSPWIGPQTSI